MKDLWCSSTIRLLSTQIWIGGRICGALVQFGCYQHRHEWMCPIYVRLSLNYHACTCTVGTVLIAWFHDCVLGKSGQIANPIMAMVDPVPYYCICAHYVCKSINCERRKYSQLKPDLRYIAYLTEDSIHEVACLWRKGQYNEVHTCTVVP